MGDTCAIQSTFQTQFKVSIIGCGNVGATAGYAMLLDGTPTELVMIDASCEKAEGIALDFEHALPFLSYTKITGSGDITACANSQLVVVTAGARQQDGETRLDLIKKNRAIFKEMIPKIAKAAPESILLIVSNPVDVLTLEALKLSKFPRSRVFGTGTMLDTSRLRFHIGEMLCISPQSVEAFIFGEHGDTSFPIWSSANSAGKPLIDFPHFTKKTADECYEKTKNAAYRIIHDVGYTCYSIATVVKEVMRHIFHNSRLMVPLSVVLNGEYGLREVALSVPCILGSDGVSEVVEVPLSAEEKKQLDHSAEVLRGYAQ